jgi:hypothetical protein
MRVTENTMTPINNTKRLKKIRESRSDGLLFAIRKIRGGFPTPPILFLMR